jgi:integrase
MNGPFSWLCREFRRVSSEVIDGLEDGAMGSLTLKMVERLKSKPGRYGDKLGLYLQVLSPTNSSWLFRYERAGRERWMGLGALHTFNLLEARERARKARQQLADGLDPLAARDAEAAARALAASKNRTFEECGHEFFDTNSGGWKNKKHRDQFLSSMNAYVYPVIGKIGVADIDVGLVLSVLNKKYDRFKGQTLWEARPETATRVQQRLFKVLAWATVRGFRSGDNPARWDGFLSTQLPARTAKVKHHPALAFDEMPAFMADLRTRGGSGAKALEFLILCAARTGAVIGATWDEIDLGAKVWTVPPDRIGAKIDGDKPRRVPLSPAAMALLEALPREEGNPFVFIGGRDGAGLSGAAMSRVLELMGRDDVTVHGFRSTFKDWCAERTNYPNHVSEAALWHSVADAVEKAYRRGDLFEKRRRLMNDWARYCGSPAVSSVVVDLARTGT